MNQLIAESALRELANAAKRLETDPNNHNVLKKMIFHGVRLVGSWRDSNFSNVDSRWKIACAVLDCLEKITPNEFVTIFPISKRYDGEKYGIKDYFYTVEMIRKHGWDNPIKNPFDFFWDYENRKVSMFVIQLTDLMDVLRKREGKRSVAAEFMDSMGVDSYTLHTTEKGKQFLMDKRGKTFPVKKARPKHLKVVRSK